MSEYRIVKRSGSLDLSREVQTLVEQLCLESKSDLEVKYTRVLEAEKQAKDMLSVYKSAQKLKETYRMTTGMEKVWKELREREEKNGGKPLESGSKLSQEWVTQVVRIMKDYKSCFPKVGSSSLYLLEISERSCKDLSSLKRSVEELKKAGVVKEVYWDHKSYHETLEYLQLDPGRIESYLRGRKESSKKEFEESARVCLSELQRDGWERYQTKSCNNMKEKTLLEVLKGWHKSKNTGVMGHWEIFSSMTEGGVNPLLEKLRLTGPEDVKYYVQVHKEVIPNVLGSYFAPRAKEEHKKAQEQTKVQESSNPKVIPAHKTDEAMISQLSPEFRELVRKTREALKNDYPFSIVPNTGGLRYLADKEHTMSQLALYLTGPDYTLDKDNVEAIFMSSNALETGNHLVGNAIDIVPLRKDKGSDIDYADKVRTKMKEFIGGKDKIQKKLNGDPMHIEFYPNGTRVEKQYNSEITALLEQIKKDRLKIIPVKGSQVWIVYGAADHAKPENERNLTREKQKELAALLKKYQPKLLELLDKQRSTKQ